MNYNNYKLSKFVDDFLVDNINNINKPSNLYKTCYVNNLSIQQYFPYDIRINYDHLKIDDISKYSITLPNRADIISRIILSYFNITENSINRIIITDATAGVGGNVLSFCKYKLDVNAVEIDKDRFSYLLENIKEYNYNDVMVYNRDYVEIYEDIKQDVIFIDPPWGGVEYKNVLSELTLKLGSMEIEELCININRKKLSKITVLKLPYNYNINYIKCKINIPMTIYRMKNILLVVIMNDII
jgi:16S rRNA G966 N2-methylase RsmD